MNEKEGSESVWHLFPVLAEGDRSSFQEHLRGAEISTGVHYPVLIPEQQALRGRADCEVLTPLPHATDFALREVSLPIHPFLSDEDVQRVVETCNAWQR